MAGKHGKRHNLRAHKQEAVSDGLNPLSLGTMTSITTLLASHPTTLANKTTNSNCYPSSLTHISI